MEEDRAQTNLSSAPASAQADSEIVQDVQKVPKKRFIGRRAAAEKAAKDGSVNIEDPGAVQGQFNSTPRITALTS